MKIILSLLFLVFWSKNSFSQDIKIIISSLKIVAYSQEEKDYVTSHDGDGPNILLYCSIINNSSSSVLLNPSLAKYYISYNYENKTYRKDLFPLSFMDQKSAIIDSGDTLSFTVDDLIFLGTPILSQEKNCYLKDLMKVLPTMCFYYEDLNHSLVTKGALKVIID